MIKLDNILTKHYRIDPNNTDPLYNKCGALNELEKYDEVIQYNDKALQIYPNDTLVLSNKSNALICLEKYDEVIQNL